MFDCFYGRQGASGANADRCQIQKLTSRPVDSTASDRTAVDVGQRALVCAPCSEQQSRCAPSQECLFVEGCHRERTANAARRDDEDRAVPVPSLDLDLVNVAVTVTPEIRLLRALDIAASGSGEALTTHTHYPHDGAKCMARVCSGRR